MRPPDRQSAGGDLILQGVCSMCAVSRVPLLRLVRAGVGGGGGEW